MGNFWKNEWNLFVGDMKELGDFCLQPIQITILPFQKKNLELRPSMEEAEYKASTGESDFWSNQANLFKEECRNAKEFLTQPVNFTL